MTSKADHYYNPRPPYPSSSYETDEFHAMTFVASTNRVSACVASKEGPLVTGDLDGAGQTRTNTTLGTETHTVL